MPAQPLPPVSEPATEMEMSYLKFIEGKGQRVEIMDPLSDEGLRLQALYVQNFSQHPMDVVRRMMENPFTDPKDRLSAAKLLMEFTQRKPTQNMSIAASGTVVTLDPSTLKALNTKELDALEKILEKLA